jgi:surface carbohydrate biosynthesis protein (TIGR04326 family)
MGLRDLIATFYESFVKRLKFKEKVFLGEMDISELVRAEFKECFYGAKFLENLLCHRKVLKLAENLDIKKYLYTFEGYAWERMSIMGLKSHKNDIEIIGFQHAFVSKNSFRYFPGERERDILPLPDKIVTMGQITKEILQRFGHYPNLNIVEGCALRQERTLQLDKIPRGEKKNIFIPLTIAVDDTVRVINFIYEAGLGSYPYKIFLRFHPLTPRKKVIAQLKNPLPENFIISDTAFLADEFQRCGVVLYTWTTVCLEAVLVGLPVIYLDINAPLNVDPLFDLSHLKESVGSPGELLDKINGLLNLNQSNFEKLYHDSREYIRRYLYPVTDSAMNCFY